MNRRTIMVLMAPVLLAAGCTESAAAPPENSLLLDDYADQATETFVEIVDRLVDAGLEPYFGAFDYRRCDSDPPEFMADAFGRVDHPDGGVSTRADAEAIRDMLVDDGWTMRENERFDNGLWDGLGRRWRINATTGDVGADVNLSAEESLVLISVYSLCVGVTDSQEDAFALHTHADLDIGATTTTAKPGTPPTPETVTTWTDE